MLDNLVFHYNSEHYDKISEKLRNYTHSFRVNWELVQMEDSPIWKKCFTVLVSDPVQLFVNNFHSYGEDASLRCFPLQIHWFNFVNMSLEDIEKQEEKQFKFMLKILENVEIKRWHFELTLTVARSQPIFEKIVQPLMKLGWGIKQLQPDPEKILYRDKYSLWHLVHPSRKVLIKGYVANNFFKYPKAFENMTKVELVVPTMTEPNGTIFHVLLTAQKIRRLLFSEDLIKEARQIIWAKAMVQPSIYTWFNNSNSLSLAWFFLKFSQQEEITPFPHIYTSQREALAILREIQKQLEKNNNENIKRTL